MERGRAVAGPGGPAPHRSRSPASPAREPQARCGRRHRRFRPAARHRHRDGDRQRARCWPPRARRRPAGASRRRVAGPHPRRDRARLAWLPRSGTTRRGHRRGGRAAGQRLPPPRRADRARRPPGWEPDESLVNRAVAALVRIHELVPDGEVLGVTHGGLVYALEAMLGAPFVRLPNLGGRWFDVGPADPSAWVSGWCSSIPTSSPSPTRSDRPPPPTGSVEPHARLPSVRFRGTGRRGRWRGLSQGRR